MDNEPIVKYLKDYKKTDFLIKKIELDFQIFPNKLLVKSNLSISKNSSNSTLTLNGEDLKTIVVSINNKIIEHNKDYVIKKDTMEIYNVPDHCNIITEVEIDPYNNTKLMGIYKTNTGLASQCEPEGFRRITWFIDRPDVMPLWSVTIRADKDSYQSLLSNGNIISSVVESNTRICKFEDPFPKPSYLFAFVAGNFDIYSDKFITKSNKMVDLNILVEQGKKSQAKFAVDSLKKAMKWDEDTFSLEYELNVFSIVAVSDFNFGAMENTSLNIFNEVYVLADPYIATDDDFFNIESIVAHEYFHNFTGNKITCRDWFQLTLKEGLTVYRDHIFSEDLRHKDIVRINDVETLRNHQFPEDNGPLSHPIRPTSYIEMNNFYTSTVYEKGSEVIRMIATLIGKDNFRKGMEIYFDKFSGSAVTCEDFISSMEQASGLSLELFKRWYLQSGTPVVDVITTYDETNKTYTIRLSQTNNPTFDQKEKFTLVIPLKLALFSSKGEQLILINDKKEYLAVLEEKEKEFVFHNIVNKPTLSINRFFSAPVKINFIQSDEELINLIINDSDGFTRFESSQKYLINKIQNLVFSLENNTKIEVAELNNLVMPYGEILRGYKNDPYIVSAMLKLPSFVTIEQLYESDLPIEHIMSSIQILEEAIASTHENILYDIFNNISDDEEIFSTEMMGKRSLKNKVLFYLLKTNKEKYFELALDYFNNTKSMTKKIGTLLAIKDFPNIKEHNEIFKSFYKQYEQYPTVLNKWFALSAGVKSDMTVEKIIQLSNLPTFSYTNPNKVKHLFSGFINNNLAFHKLDGSGYKLLEETIIKMDLINPHISASLAKAFSKLNIQKPIRKNLMKKSIDTILVNKDISKGLYEILAKLLINK